jgi:hypothetical protein
MKHKIITLLLTFLCVSCGNPSINYDLYKQKINESLKFGGNGLTIIKDNEDYKIRYSSINVVHNEGYEPSALIIDNKSSKKISIHKVKFYQTYKGIQKETPISYEGQIDIEPFTNRQNLFPKKSFSIEIKDSIDNIYDHFKAVKEIEVRVYIEMMIGNAPAVVDENFKVFQHKTLYR